MNTVTANDVLKLIMSKTFDALEGLGAFRKAPPATPVGYAMALAAQKARADQERD